MVQLAGKYIYYLDAIKKRRMKLPVKCAVNQGYVKLVDVGTYVLDLKGSLMEFTTQDLETAVGRKLIVLWMLWYTYCLNLYIHMILYIIQIVTGDEFL